MHSINLAATWGLGASTCAPRQQRLHRSTITGLPLLSVIHHNWQHHQSCLQCSCASLQVWDDAILDSCQPDCRMATTLIEVCTRKGDTSRALSTYQLMQEAASGSNMAPSVHAYTAAMRAAAEGGAWNRALDIWSDMEKCNCKPTGAPQMICCVCLMQQFCAHWSSLLSGVFESLCLWTVPCKVSSDRSLSSKAFYWKLVRLKYWAPCERLYASTKVKPFCCCHVTNTQQGCLCGGAGHAYAAVISACAAGGAWQRAVQLFDQMLQYQIKPDVVSCTALITALGADGQWKRGSQVVDWMLRSGVKPNVRTYTALITAMGNAQKWDLALDLIKRMKTPQAWGTVEPNAYTYSALLKTMGEQVAPHPSPLAHHNCDHSFVVSHGHMAFMQSASGCVQPGVAIPIACYS